MRNKQETTNAAKLTARRQQRKVAHNVLRTNFKKPRSY